MRTYLLLLTFLAALALAAPTPIENTAVVRSVVTRADKGVKENKEDIKGHGNDVVVADGF
ncbi:hypothetical protein N7517_007408 [Penicillium concentricum]|uniref:RxLR effector protein n=1 Tax=Penicillium concentricum TaxID=293559 RepID=A0A9W9VB18_9EURO|nr:uncharacterized protein N7517_007408 [Penicillium concentricum]KAJ5375402.1 hypothetical protein N7517_007408 [Penicillium concentricum]